MPSKKLVFSTFFVAGLIGLPMMAHAGFDWTPSPIKSAPAPQPGMQAPVADGPLTPEPDAVMDAPPVPVTDVDSQALPPPGTMASAEEGQTMTPTQESVDQPQDPVELVDTTAEPIPTPIQNDKVLEGFGKEIPLALALRDIVPPEYAYSFADNAYAGRIISWRGGKPWQDVLNNALANQGLTSTMAGNAVVIESIEAVKARQMDAAAKAAIKSEPVAEAPKPAIPVMKVGVTRTWQGRPGYTLKEVVGDWSKLANVELEWQSPYDYPINSAFNYEGTFEEAVRNLLSQYSRETPRPRGRLYPNLPEGPSVLMIN